jgi:DNA replication factor GINS
MKVTYELIRKIHRLEKKSNELTKLSDSFIEELKKYIDEEKSNIKDTNIFDDTQIRKMYNIKNMVEEIFSIRQKKIINKAILKYKTGEDKISNLILPEQKMYDKILNNIKDYFNIIEEVFVDKKTKKKHSLLKVKVSQDFPKFIGTDMNEYGPFKEGEIVELPESTAKLIINKNIGEIVE